MKTVVIFVSMSVLSPSLISFYLAIQKFIQKKNYFFVVGESILKFLCIFVFEVFAIKKRKQITGPNDSNPGG